MTKERTPDDMDMEIVGRLGDDSRISNKAIASQLSVSEETVRRRINTLIGNRQLGFSITVDPQMFGYNEHTLFNLKVTNAPGSDIEVKGLLIRLSAITRAYKVMEEDGIHIMAEASSVDLYDVAALLFNFNTSMSIESFTMKRIIDEDYRVSRLPIS